METYQSLLDAMDKGAAIVRDGAVMVANTAMLERTLVAGVFIVVGQPLPEQLCDLVEGDGTVTFGASQLDYSAKRMPTGELLLLIWQEENRLGRETLDGFFYRLREEMSVSSVSLEGLGAMSELERVQRLGQMKKSFYSMVRLLEQVEILRGEYLHRDLEVVDITAFCQRIQLEHWSLMEEIGVSIEVEPQDYHLHVKVEGELLEKFVFSAIATAIEHGAKRVWLKPALSAKRAKITIVDDRPTQAKERTLREKLREELLGAQSQLDIDAMREMVRMMGGRMLLTQNKNVGATCTFSMPICKVGAGLPVFAPDTNAHQRYNRLLVQFAALLPAKLFRGREIE